MKKELVEKMKAAFVANHGKPVTKDSLLSVVIEQCAAVASEHYGDKWHPVTELPKPIELSSYERVELWVFTDAWANAMVGYYFPFNGTFEAYNAGNHNVTHWMPLPQPPQQ